MYIYRYLSNVRWHWGKPKIFFLWCSLNMINTCLVIVIDCRNFDPFVSSIIEFVPTVKIKWHGYKIVKNYCSNIPSVFILKILVPRISEHQTATIQIILYYFTIAVQYRHHSISWWDNHKCINVSHLVPLFAFLAILNRFRIIVTFNIVHYFKISTVLSSLVIKVGWYR